LLFSYFYENDNKSHLKAIIFLREVNNNQQQLLLSLIGLGGIKG